MNLKDAMIKIARDYKSDAEAAAAYEMTKQQWSRLKNGIAYPTKRTLDNLGLKASYEFIETPRS